MKKSLFDENEFYTNISFKLSNDVAAVVRKVLEDAAKEGYSIRQIQLIAEGAVQGVCLDMIDLENTLKVGE